MSVTFQELKAQFDELIKPIRNFRKATSAEWGERCRKKARRFIVDAEAWLLENPNDDAIKFMLEKIKELWS